MGGFKSPFDHESSSIKLRNDGTRFFGKENRPKSTGSVLPMSLRPRNSGASEPTLPTLPVEAASPTCAKSVCSTARLPVLAKLLKSNSIANICVCFEKKCRCTMGKRHQVHNVELDSPKKYVDFGNYGKRASRTESKLSLSESKESSIFDAADGAGSNSEASESVSSTLSGVAHFFNGVKGAIKIGAQKTYHLKLRAQFKLRRLRHSRWFGWRARSLRRRQRDMTPPSAIFLDIHEYLSRNQCHHDGRQKTNLNSVKLAMDRTKARVSKNQAKINLLQRSGLMSFYDGDKVVVRDPLTGGYRELERLKPVAPKPIAPLFTREESVDEKLARLLAEYARRRSALRTDRIKRGSDGRSSSSKKVSMPSSSSPKKRSPLPKEVEKKAEPTPVCATRAGTYEVIEAVENYAKEMGLSLSPKSDLSLRSDCELPLRIRSKIASLTAVCDNIKTIAKSTRKNSDAKLNLSNKTGSTNAGSFPKFEKHAADACTGAELVKVDLVKARPQSLIDLVAKAIDDNADDADSRTGAELVEAKLVKTRPQSLIDLVAKAIDADVADPRTGAELVEVKLIEAKLVKAKLVKARPQSLIDDVAKAIDAGADVVDSRTGANLVETKQVRKVKARPQSLIDVVAKAIDDGTEATLGERFAAFKLVRKAKARPHSLIDDVAKAIDDGTEDELKEKSITSKLVRKVRPQSLIDVVAKAIDAGEASSTRCELDCKELQKPRESHSTRLTSMDVNNGENCRRKRPASLRSSIGSSTSSKNEKTLSLSHSGKADVIKVHSSSKSSKKGTLRALKEENSTGVTGDVNEKQLDHEVGIDRLRNLKVKVVDYEPGTLNWKKCLRRTSVKKNSNASRLPGNRFEGRVLELALCFEGIGKEVGTSQKPKVT